MDISGSRSINLPFDQELNVQAAKTFGDKKFNATTGLYMAGNMRYEPGMVGAFAELMAETISVSMQLSNTFKCFRILSFAIGVEVFNKCKHIVSLDGKYSYIKMENGNKIKRETYGLSYKHAHGHNVYLAISNIGNYNAFTIDASAKANLWKSRDKTTTLDLTVNVWHHLSGPFAGKTRYGSGLGLTHHF